MREHFLFGIVSCCVVLLVHVWSLLILWKKKQLKKNNFLRLVISLSVSDTCFAVEYIYNLINTSFIDNSTLLFQYQRLILSNLIGGTFVFSLFQTFQICMERLNATFFPKKEYLTLLTSKTSSVVCFILCHFIALLRINIQFFFSFPPSDGHSYTTSLLYYVTVDVPGIILLTLINICFISTVVRIRRQNLKIGQIANTNDQIVKIKDRNNEVNRNIKTVIILICLTMVGIVPREICLLVIHSSDKNQIEHLRKVLVFLNILTVVNPVCDPILFFFRFQTIRNEVRKVLCYWY